MARLPRLVLAHEPIHVMVKGHNRQTVFEDEKDYKMYIEWLRDAAREYDLAIHAYALLPYQVHLLATPQNTESVARVMQSVGRRYVQWFNQKHQSTGTVWEGRYRSNVLEAQPYFLATQKYIELMPLHSGLISQVSDWGWSTYNHHIGGEVIPWLTDHPLYWALGNTPFERQLNWKKQMADGLSNDLSKKISENLLHGWPLGHASWLKSLASKTSRPLQPRPAGRPSKKSNQVGA